jgi:Gram-negative bacterial TonB protein C-terminal
MTQLITRAVPFVIAFVLGVACTAIVRSVLPKDRKFFQERSRCNWKAKSSGGVFQAVPYERSSTPINIVEVDESGLTRHVPFTLTNSYSTRLSLKEQALYFRALQEEARSSPGSIVSYVSREAIDGKPVTSDAVLFDIPRPRFWGDERARSRQLDCNAIVRVELGSSGRVSDVEKVHGHADKCPRLSDVLEAASNISFRPATRNGVPVTQRVSIMYRLN